MTQNSDFQDTKLENHAISYRNRLNSWTIARVLASQERVIVARFRTKSDADGYIQHLQQLSPDTVFELFFDYRQEEVTV
ncbi:MAG: hypothetical protein F6K62_23635 [Sphaerospermopsis sp. SIO1G2]|nr:hypothetical protein [Sphaerospermopsis sp. SIO1G1]NET73815.1 hypothetical protein [Sphaerospermopsis sp. SIO1G2]